MNALWFMVAAVFEIAGCYCFWMWYKLDKSPYWLLPGMVSLALFAWVLTLVEASFAGRVYAAYGGIYIAMSLLWAAIIEKHLPSIWDGLGATLCITGALIIFFNAQQAA
ncbi:YnfA family protein [Marinomonas sp. M1K-6]|uniref:YnfA family protein n=1 Tax=Marinomonas profundi TaxID=2726122 RepID=A0A847RDL3_9GAMM|nr:YnfA family protein [Marinomonas profundi]NLQ19154.1 YnfA family protein [Marinomonas profundi]UDV04060.1 YnfA family protein [Marinomonas profundi]